MKFYDKNSLYATCSVLCASGPLPLLFNPMITNPFVNRLAVIALMFAVYAAGISNGREQTVLTAQSKPVCQQVLKP
jgi:hypothetical protein